MLVYLITIVLSWLLFFIPIFTGSVMHDDLRESFYPAFALWTDALRQLDIPFTNPYVFSTIPFVSSPSFFLLNPIWFLHLLVGMFNNSFYMLQVLVAFNYLLAGLFAFFYLRRHFEGRLALLGAMAYMLSGIFVVKFVHYVMFYFFPLIPIALWLVELGGVGFALLLGVVWSFMLYSGHPQLPLFLLFPLMLSYFLSRRFKELLAFVSSVAIFLLSYYLNFHEIYAFSSRTASDVRFLLEISYDPDMIITFVVPKFYGANEEGFPFVKAPYYIYTETLTYVSIPVLLFFVYALLNFRNFLGNRLFVVSVLTIAFMFFIALGENNPLVKLAYESGLIKGFRAPGRALNITPIFFIIVALMGISHFAKLRDVRKLLVSSGLLVGVLVLFLPASPKLIDVSGEVLKFFIILSASLFASLWLNRYRMHALSLVVFADLYSFGNPYLKRNFDIENYYNPPWISLFSDHYLGKYRINARSKQALVLPRNSGMVNKLELTEGYEPMVSAYYMQFYTRIVERVEGFENLLAMANVKYFIDKQGFRRTPDFLPRAYIVFDAEVIEDSILFFKKVSDFEPQRTVYLQDEPKKTYNDTLKYIPASIEHYDYGNMELSYDSPKDGILVLSVSYYPHYKAYIDGNEVPILRANWTFMAIEVPSGKHKVSFKYDTSELKLSLLLYALGFLLGLIPLYNLGWNGKVRN